MRLGIQEIEKSTHPINTLFFIDPEDTVLYLSSNSLDKDRINHFKSGALQPTGFLGSGKTTLLNRVLRDPGYARTAVIVNEFGDIGIDHDLIDASDDAVVLLENGCLCCAVRSDLVATLADLFQRRARGSIRHFDRVVIETSGLAEPTPVLEVLLSEPSVKARYVPAGVLATVDAVNGAATLDAHVESVQQLALADRIVVTKTDLPQVDVRSLRALQQRIAALNPMADIVPPAGLADAGSLLRFTPQQLLSHGWRSNSLDDVLAVPAGGASHHHGGAARHAHLDPRIQRFSIVRDQPWELQTLELLLDALAQNAGPRLLRVKGIIAVAQEPERAAVVHGAQNLVHKLEWLPAWPSADRRTRLVFITRDLAAGEVEDIVETVERLSQRTRQLHRRAALGEPSG